MNVRTLSEYEYIIKKLNAKYGVDNNPCFLYRGHTDHIHYELLPGIFRTVNIGEKWSRPYNQDERAIISEYSESSTKNIRDYRDWISVAQHYQVPTRLLDLTEDEYVALYFACESETSCDSFPSVWLINRPNYLKFFFASEIVVNTSWSEKDIVNTIIEEEITNRTPDLHINPEKFVMRPYIFKPKWIDQREINQKSWFMIWGASQRKLSDLVCMNHTNSISIDPSAKADNSSILGVITVDPRCRESILSELASIGYSKEFIYPTNHDHGVTVKEKNYNSCNRQYEEYRAGAVSIILSECEPNKESFHGRTMDK